MQQNNIDLPIRNDIPNTLKTYDQWINWDWRITADETLIKIMVSEAGTFEEAYERIRKSERPLGLGFKLSEEDPFVAIRLQNAIDTEKGTPKPWALGIAERLGSYMEVSTEPSSLLILSTGHSLENESRGDIDLFYKDAFVAITGKRFGQIEQITHGGIEIEEVRGTYFRLTWMDFLMERATDGPITRELLQYALSECLQSILWAEEPEYSKLYDFLALCWEYPELRVKVLERIANERWTKERREAFLTCILDLMPSPPPPPLRQPPINNQLGPMLSFPLQYDNQNRVKENFYNYTQLFRFHPEWKDRVKFDRFQDTVMLDDHPATDVIEGKAHMWFGEHFQFGGNHHKVLTRAMFCAGNERSYDSLYDWVTQLDPWDEKSRLYSWMYHICGSEPTQYVSWVGYVSIMQMIARALKPGCMARLVPVFEGPENQGKTQCIKILGEPWSITFDMSMDSKEAHMAVQGCWVAELAELDSMHKTTETRLKSFISQTEDSFVPKYANHRVSHPRRTLFFGTTNETTYLPNPTGNTRFLPVKTGPFDLERLKKERKQIFAEALSIFEATPHIKWWEPPESLKETIAQEREWRTAMNVFTDSLREWLDGEVMDEPYKESTTWREIASRFLKIETPERWKDKNLQNQLLNALKSLGWSKKHTKKGNLWIREKND